MVDPAEMPLLQESSEEEDGEEDEEEEGREEWKEGGVVPSFSPISIHLYRMSLQARRVLGLPLGSEGGREGAAAASAAAAAAAATAVAATKEGWRSPRAVEVGGEGW